ncbi:NAD(P)-dependent oxidoreductase [Massilia sp. erpn]|uniref:NAD-dependent epimerase/dehydratase family protein n=1 Tax=Massilia sp. erpn TaxID=2738142 RepID=UPI002102341D|nr:SDR family oxidoreductase [Massilia sp. erpn]UTY57080.1 SDR family oxidoreductase [Massilia sp. erpn]
MKHEKVLVVGGGGYLGTALCQGLLDAGFAVKSVDAGWFGNAGWRSLDQHKRYEYVELDTRRLDLLSDAVRGCDAVMHLSGVVGDPACAIDEDFTFSCNYLSTTSLAKICKRAGVKRFVFASSCSVYGKASQELVDERSPTNPLSAYARDKLMCEAELQGMCDDDFSPVMLRLSTLFGWSQRMRFDLVVNLLTAQASNGAPLKIFGGNQWRPFVHVNDAARAFQMALEAPAHLVAGETFNVGSSENNHRIIDVAHRIRDLLPATALNIIPQMADHRDYAVSFEKIQTVLGYRAEVSLEAGVREIMGELANYGQFDPDHPLFNNFLRTKELVALAGRQQQELAA